MCSQKAGRFDEIIQYQQQIYHQSTQANPYTNDMNSGRRHHKLYRQRYKQQRIIQQCKNISQNQVHESNIYRF